MLGRTSTWLAGVVVACALAAGPVAEASAAGRGGEPVVLVIHGGGFIHGSPAAGQTAVDWFKAQGVSGRSIKYRLTKASDGFADVKREMRKELRRGRRVFVIGYSAGGTFALRLAQTGRPEAVIAYAPPTDLQTFRMPMKWNDINEALTPRERRIVTPWKRCTDRTSPTLIVHGTEDTIVPYAKSERYAADRRCRARVEPRAGEGHFNLRVRPGWEWLLTQVRRAR